MSFIIVTSVNYYYHYHYIFIILLYVRLRLLAAHLIQASPGLEIDIESELAYYNSIRDEILSLTVDTISMSNAALAKGKNILIEGANATSKSTTVYCLFCTLHRTGICIFRDCKLLVYMQLFIRNMYYC